MIHIVSCLQFNSLFLSLMVPRFRVFKSWRLLSNRDARSSLLATQSVAAIAL